MYSFAIIMQEILYRRGVFYLSAEDRNINFGKRLKHISQTDESISMSEESKITYKGTI